MPPRRFVFDTNIYRYSASSRDFDARIREDFQTVRVSAVVLSELWRSARSEEARAWLTKLEKRLRDFTFVPSYPDWRQVGEYLSTRLSRAGRAPTAEALTAIRKEQNDALIALSSWNQGFVVVTCDNDFERIREWARAPAWKLVHVPAPP